MGYIYQKDKWEYMDGNLGVFNNKGNFLLFGSIMPEVDVGGIVVEGEPSSE